MGFAPKSTRGGRVIVEQLDATRWRLTEEVRYAGERDEFIVPDNYITDFATVPRIAVWLIPRFGLYTRAAILHDFLLTHCLEAGRINSTDADGLFRRAMKDLGVPPARRWLMWTGVRWGALFNAKRREGWSKDALGVIALSAAFAWLVIPMVAVGLALIPWGVIEFLATLPGRRKTTTGSLST
jgi:hypothetical protein